MQLTSFFLALVLRLFKNDELLPTSCLKSVQLNATEMDILNTKKRKEIFFPAAKAIYGFFTRCHLIYYSQIGHACGGSLISQQQEQGQKRLPLQALQQSFDDFVPRVESFQTILSPQNLKNSESINKKKEELPKSNLKSLPRNHKCNFEGMIFDWNF